MESTISTESIESHERASYPTHRSSIPKGTLRVGRYALRFAKDEADLEQIQRLRFEVFNLELHEGLESAYATGLDQDALDLRCHHLMVLAADTGQVVGTYRLMTHAMAERHGFYSEAEYDLRTLPREIARESVELGRACVAKEHRNGRVVQLLWRGIARYLAWNDKRYLFGCCSVPTTDPTEARILHRELRARGVLHESVVVRPTPAYACPEEEEGALAERLALPPLFESYLRLGAKVLSGPAIDKEFKVTDFFILLDLAELEPHVRRSFLERGGWDGEREVTIGTA